MHIKNLNKNKCVDIRNFLLKFESQSVRETGSTQPETVKKRNFT